MSSNRNRNPGRNRDRKSVAYAPVNRRAVYKWHDFKDAWLRDKDGNIVYSQVPNLPLVIFFVTGVFAVVSYHGFWHGLAQLVALLSIFLWSGLEIRSGVTRLRRLMGKLALGATVIVLILYLWR